MTAGSTARALRQVCVSREFTKLRTGETTPVAGWLRSLARDLHAELGGPGVGALGMCFTGGFALAMMVDPAVAAPVLCQPSTPFAIGPTRSRDVNLSPADLDIVKGRCAAGQQVLGVRYRQGPGRRQALRDAHHRAGRRLHPRGARGQGALHRDRPPLAGGRRRRARVLRRAAALAPSSVEEGRSPVTKPLRRRVARNRPQPWPLSVVADTIEHMIETLAGPGAGEVEDLTAPTCWPRSRAARRPRTGRPPTCSSLAARWADLHPPESIHDAAAFTVPGCEHEEPIAGEGAPLVAEFCLAELGAVLGISTTAAKKLVGHALELRHRLRGCGRRSRPDGSRRGGPARSRRPPSTPPPR